VRANYIEPEKLNELLTKMMPPNALALRVSLHTGLRIDDVLAIKTEQIKRSARITVREKKTGKSRRVYLPMAMRCELMSASGSLYAFPARVRSDSHRTRQAVYLDLKRACKALKIDPAHVSPHSVRKTYAVKLYERVGSLEAVQARLKHTNPAVTVLYALADKLRERVKVRRSRKDES
jgi:integrase